MRRFIKCPKCLLDNREKILGEILSTGDISIERQRNKWAYEDATLIRGKDFILVCGYCRTEVYRKERGEDYNFAKVWIHQIKFIPGTIIQITQEIQRSNIGSIHA